MSVFHLFIVISFFVSGLWAQESKNLLKLADPDVTLKVDGRMFLGVYATQKDGEFPNRTMDIPDAKLRLTFNIGPNLVIVNRFSNPRASSGGFDYFYVDLKNWMGVLPGHTIRVGKMKYDYGVEIWTDNPVESFLITNSAGIAQGTDEGIQFMGDLIPQVSKYSLGVFNGSDGVRQSSSGLTYVSKLGVTPVEPLFVSGSFFVNKNFSPGFTTSDFRVGGLNSFVSTSWERLAWQLDLRWNYGKDGIFPAVGKIAEDFLQVAFSFGSFTDKADTVERKGNTWMVEAVVNLMSNFYLAGRFSDIKLDKGSSKFWRSPVAGKEYQRLSLGLGYRLHKMALLKVEGTNNSLKDYSRDERKPKLNQIALGLAVKF